MSETGIEEDARYTRAERRVKSGTEFLVSLVVYALACIVLVLDIFFWRV